MRAKIKESTATAELSKHGGKNCHIVGFYAVHGVHAYAACAVLDNNSVCVVGVPLAALEIIDEDLKNALQQ